METYEVEVSWSETTTRRTVLTVQADSSTAAESLAMGLVRNAGKRRLVHGGEVKKLAAT